MSNYAASGRSWSQSGSLAFRMGVKSISRPVIGQLVKKSGLSLVDWLIIISSGIGTG